MNLNEISCHTQNYISKNNLFSEIDSTSYFPKPHITEEKTEWTLEKTCDPIFHIFKDNCHNMGFSVLIVLGWRLAAQLILLISANSVTHLTPQWDGDSCRLDELRNECGWTCKWAQRGPVFEEKPARTKPARPKVHNTSITQSYWLMWVA